MLKNIWINYQRYIKVAKKESKLALIFGVIGALSETFSIYLLANLITNLDKNKLIININFLNQVSFSKEIYILFFLISAILSAFLYFLSNKNIVKAKCLIERSQLAREWQKRICKRRDYRFNSKYKMGILYTNESRRYIKSNTFRGTEHFRRIYVLYFCHNIFFYCVYLFYSMFNFSSRYIFYTNNIRSFCI